MTSIFDPHFWHHIWGKWSKPVPGVITYAWGTQVETMFQERECRVCGKREVQKL